MLHILVLISVCLADPPAAPSDATHVYRYALRTRGKVAAATFDDLPAQYLVERGTKEGIARVTKDPWWAPREGWAFVFEGSIQDKLRLGPWRVNDLLVFTVDGVRRVFLELRSGVQPFRRDRLRLVELRFEGLSRATPRVDRVTLVPLRFDLGKLDLEHHAYRRPVSGPAWSRRKVLEVSNQTSPENLVRLMEPTEPAGVSLIPADEAGYARLHRFVTKYGVALHVPAAASGAAGCAPRLQLVR